MGLTDAVRSARAEPATPEPPAPMSPVAVALLSLPPRSAALLTFFFANAGRGTYVEVAEADAEAAIFDLDAPDSRAHWLRFAAAHPRPGLAMAVHEQDVPGATWLRKPVTPAALLDAAPALRAPRTPTAAAAGGAVEPAVASPPVAPPSMAPLAAETPDTPVGTPPAKAAGPLDSADEPASSGPAPGSAPVAPQATAPALPDVVRTAFGDAARAPDGPPERDAARSAAVDIDLWRTLGAVTDDATRKVDPTPPAAPTRVAPTPVDGPTPAVPAADLAPAPTSPEPVAARVTAFDLWSGRLRRWLRPAAGAPTTAVADVASPVAAAPGPAAPPSPALEAVGAVTPDATEAPVPPAAGLGRAADASPAALPPSDDTRPQPAAAEPGDTDAPAPAAPAPALAAPPDADPLPAAADGGTDTDIDTDTDVDIATARPALEARAEATIEAPAPEPAPEPFAASAPRPEAAAPDPAWFGTEADVAPARLAADAARRYDPESFLCGVLREAWLVSSRWQVPTRIDTPAGSLVVVAARNALHGAADDAALAALAREPLAARPKVHTLTDADCDAFVRALGDRAAPRRLDAALWRTALDAGAGRLPAAIDPQRVTYLRHWPNLTRLAAIPHMARLAALWAGRGTSVVEAARTLGLPQREVIAFANAAWALNLLTDDGSYLRRAQRRATRHRGLLGRLLGWLRA